MAGRPVRLLAGHRTPPLARAVSSGLPQLRSGDLDKRRWDVVVIGGGHAGCEAASAACRTGAKTLLVTQRADTVGIMSCNPSIGGVGKGTLVREVDAMGGLMGRAADKAGVMFRLLNRSKGPAVWGLRCQADRKLYKEGIQELLAAECRERGLEVLEGAVHDIRTAARVGSSPPHALRAVVLADGRELRTAAVVITTGTFLRGRLLLGRQSQEGGRIGEAAASQLARTFERVGVRLSRLKTGTPPRLVGSTIDWEGLDVQKGDPSPVPFSFLHDSVPHADQQVDCFMTRTCARTHDIVRAAQHLAPEHTGAEPRYCPSIDSKVKRFGHQESHQVRPSAGGGLPPRARGRPFTPMGPPPWRCLPPGAPLCVPSGVA